MLRGCDQNSATQKWCIVLCLCCDLARLSFRPRIKLQSIAVARAAPISQNFSFLPLRELGCEMGRRLSLPNPFSKGSHFQRNKETSPQLWVTQTVYFKLPIDTNLTFDEQWLDKRPSDPSTSTGRRTTVRVLSASPSETFIPYLLRNKRWGKEWST